MEARESGSAKLIAGLDKPCVFETAHLKGLLETLDKHQLKLVDWQCRGQPVPEWVAGSVQVDLASAGRAVQTLLEVEGIRICCLDGFPKGTPNPVDFRLAFEAVPGL